MAKADEPKKPNRDQLRAIADQVIRHALADANFRKELKANPRQVLQDAGLPAAALDDVEREIQIDGPTAAARVKCSDTCYLTCFWTCWTTGV
jgi:hypothetical protein